MTARVPFGPGPASRARKPDRTRGGIDDVIGLAIVTVGGGLTAGPQGFGVIQISGIEDLVTE
jgi:hypothetical protein